MPLRLAAQRPRTAGPRPLTASPSAINIPQIATTPVALQRAQHDAQVATVADRRRTSDSVKCVRKERVAWMALALAQRGVSTLIWPHMAVHTFPIPPARVGQGAAALPNELTAQRRLACEDQSTRQHTPLRVVSTLKSCFTLLGFVQPGIAWPSKPRSYTHRPSRNATTCGPAATHRARNPFYAMMI